MRLKSIFSLIAWLSIVPAWSQQNLYDKLKSLYQETVPLIQPEELQQWKKQGKELVLLDTRSPNEYQVSHLQGAQLIDYETFNEEKVEDVSRSAIVVVYCSVGYRSERIGEKMKELGFQQVYNLYGGIFNWKNQGHTVVNMQNQPTDSVHAYNRIWGQWLKQGIKVYD